MSTTSTHFRLKETHVPPAAHRQFGSLTFRARCSLCLLFGRCLGLENQLKALCSCHRIPLVILRHSLAIVGSEHAKQKNQVNFLVPKSCLCVRKLGAGLLNMDRENVGEMWRKSRYSPSFINMLSTSYPQTTHPHNRMWAK